MTTDKWTDKENVVCVCVYIYTHTQWNVKGWNNVICRNTDGPRDYHTKSSKSDKYKYHITYMWNLKKLIQMNLFTKQTHRHKEQT